MRLYRVPVWDDGSVEPSLRGWHSTPCLGGTGCYSCTVYPRRGSEPYEHGCWVDHAQALQMAEREGGEVPTRIQFVRVIP